MQTYNLSIPPNGSITQYTQGVKFQITQGSALTVDFLRASATVYEATNVGAGMWAKPDGGFHAIKITNTTGNQMDVSFFVTMGDAGYDQPTATLTVGGQISTQAVLDQTIANDAPVAVGTAATQALAGDTTRRGFRAMSDPANTAPIYLGSGTVTTANAAVMVNPGDYFDETQVPGAAWSAVSTAAGQLLRVMEIH